MNNLTERSFAAYSLVEKELPINVMLKELKGRQTLRKGKKQVHGPKE